MIKSSELPTYILLVVTAVAEYIRNSFEKLGLAVPKCNSSLVSTLSRKSSNEHDDLSVMLLSDYLAFESYPSFEAYFTPEPNDRKITSTVVTGVDSSSSVVNQEKQIIESDETRLECNIATPHEKLDNEKHAKKTRLMNKIRNRCRRKEARTSHEISKQLQIDSFRPRRSGRVSKLHGDGDTWIECLVVNSTNQKHKTKRSRSLFYSVKTQTGLYSILGQLPSFYLLFSFSSIQLPYEYPKHSGTSHHQAQAT